MSDTNGVNGGGAKAPTLNGVPYTQRQLDQIEAITHNIASSRKDWTRLLLDPRRDIETECGYPKGFIEAEFYQQLYDRLSIAARVVKLLPREMWQVQPSVYEDEDPDTDTEFEAAWNELGQGLRGEQCWHLDQEGSAIWEYLQRVDELSGIGQYGVLLLGFDDGKDLSEPLKAKAVRTGPLVSKDSSKEIPGTKDGTDIPVDKANPAADKSAPKSKPPFKRPPTGNRLTLNQLVGMERPSEPTLDGKPYVMNKSPSEPNPSRGAVNPSGSNYSVDGQRLDKNGQYNGQEMPGDPAADFGKGGKSLGKPSAGGPRLTYLRVFPETLAPVIQFETNVSSPRFGQPVRYLLTFNDPRGKSSGIGLASTTKAVHWTRVIHVADTLESSEVFGQPRMRPHVDHLLALKKVYGASGEGYWKSSFVQISWETQDGDTEVDIPTTRGVIESFRNSLQPDLLTQGLTAKPIAPNVVDPSPIITAHLTAIAIEIGCPMRVLMGSERGEMSSSQDDGKWNDVVKQRWFAYAIPRLVCPFVDRLVAVGSLPEPEGGYKVHVPDLESATAASKAAVLLQRTQAYGAYVSGGVEAVIPPLEYMTTFDDMTVDQAQAILDSAEQHAEKTQADEMLKQQDMIDQGLAPDPTKPSPDLQAKIAAGVPAAGGKGAPFPPKPSLNAEDGRWVTTHEGRHLYLKGGELYLHPDGPKLGKSSDTPHEPIKDVAHGEKSVTKITGKNGEEFTLTHSRKKEDLRQGKAEGLDTTIERDIKIHDKSGKQVGSATFWKNSDGTWSADPIEVHPDYRRNGLASAMYDDVERRGVKTITTHEAIKRGVDNGDYGGFQSSEIVKLHMKRQNKTEKDVYAGNSTTPQESVRNSGLLPGVELPAFNANPDGCNQYTGPGCSLSDHELESSRDEEDAALSDARDAEDDQAEESRASEDEQVQDARDAEDSSISDRRDAEDEALDREHSEAVDAAPTPEQESAANVKYQALFHNLGRKRDREDKALERARAREDRERASARKAADKETKAAREREDRERDAKRQEEDERREMNRQAEQLSVNSGFASDEQRMAFFGHFKDEYDKAQRERKERPKIKQPKAESKQPKVAAESAVSSEKVVDSYNRSARMTEEEFKKTLDSIKGLSGQEARGAAKGMGIVAPPSAPVSKLKQTMESFFTRRRGSKQRVDLSDRDKSRPSFAERAAAGDRERQEKAKSPPISAGPFGGSKAAMPAPATVTALGSKLKGGFTGGQVQHDPNLSDILDRGEHLSGKDKVKTPMTDGHCHWNTAKLYEQGKIDSVVIGYAQHPNNGGNWHQHTWGLKDGKVVETTASNNSVTAYYGVPLGPEESKAFVEHAKTAKPGMGMMRYTTPKQTTNSEGGPVTESNREDHPWLSVNSIAETRAERKARWTILAMNYSADQPRDSAGRFGHGVASTLRKIGAKVGHAEHAAKVYAEDKIADAVSRLPEPAQRVVKTAFALGKAGTKSMFATWIAGQRVAENVSKAKGATEEQARRLRGVLSGIDVAVMKPIQITLGATGLGHAALPASFIPPVTAAYLAYSSARHPLATIRAAGASVLEASRGAYDRLKKWSNPERTGPYAAFSRNAETGGVEGYLADTLAHYGYSDWFVALLSASLDLTGDLASALDLATKAITHHPEDVSSPSEDDAMRVLGVEGMVSNSFCATGEGGGIDPSCSPWGRADKAKFVGAKVGKAGHVHSAKVEQEVAAATGTEWEEDNKPYDVREEGKHAMEVKTFQNGGKNVISVHPDALLRKVKHAKDNPTEVYHTVVLDDRATYEGGKHASKYSGHRIYYKRGSGRYSVNTMHKVNDLSELRGLMDTPDKELPEKARGSLPKTREEIKRLKVRAEKAHASRMAKDRTYKARKKAGGS